MESYIEALMKVIPKELQVLRRRYRILKGIQLFHPIGRRGLSDKIGISEKMVRTETEFLKKNGFIVASGTGMALAPKGKQLIEALSLFIKKMDGLENVESRVKDILGCKEVYIVSGDADEDEETILSIGHKAAEVLLSKIQDKDIIALTGGATVHNVIEALNHYEGNNKKVTVVPARGSLGRNVAYQANTLVAKLAAKMNGPYHLLNIPDNLSPKALEMVKGEPEIQEALKKLVKANILVYGIGDAFKMARRRNLSWDIVQTLRDRRATAEVLGYYFNRQGDIIHATRSIGITMDQMTELKYPIAVAGGSSKCDAILSVKAILRGGCVIMDEGAAKGILAQHEKL